MSYQRGSTPERTSVGIEGSELRSSPDANSTLQGTNISHLGKRKIIFKMPCLGDMLVPRRVHHTKWFIFFAPQKSNIDTKDGHNFEGVTVSKPSWVSSHYFFRGCTYIGYTSSIHTPQRFGIEIKISWRHICWYASPVRIIPYSFTDWTRRTPDTYYFKREKRCMHTMGTRGSFIFRGYCYNPNILRVKTFIFHSFGVQG